MGGGCHMALLSIPSDMHGSRPSDCSSILASHHQEALQLPKGTENGNDSYHMGNMEGAEYEGVQ